MWCLAATGSGAAEPVPALSGPEPAVWDEGVGSGFKRGTRAFSFLAGGNWGMSDFGSNEAHDLALVSFSYGRIFSDVMADGHWHRGNWEWRAELFGGMQFAPRDEWIVGLTPHIRYNFATGTRWVPFLDFGAGVTATSIDEPDLSNIFEFNLQGGGGVHRFLRDNLALTLEVHFLHMSCAGISQPNDGLNGFMGMIGLTWLW